jgi:ribosome-associated heat shock protein Hsp15
MIIFMGDLQLNGVLRLDKWLWYARFMKTRSKATKFCQSSRLCVNGSIVVKAHFLVKQNDVLTFSIVNNIKIIRILKLGVRRGPSPEARALYEDISPPSILNKEDYKFQVVIGKREIGSGRPTKNQRRATDKLIAKDDQWQ